LRDQNNFFYPTTYDPHTQAADTQAIAGSQDQAGTKPEAGSMEGNGKTRDGKTRAAPPCRDNIGKGTQKTTSVREQVAKKKKEKYI
jgi:hypothetical protein